MEEVHPEKDGLVRIATVKTGRGTYLRPVTRLVPLLSEGGGTIDQTFAGGEDVQDSKSLHQGKKGEADTPPEWSSSRENPHMGR